MKLLWIPALILVLLYQCFLGCWLWSGSQLPDHVRLILMVVVSPMDG